MMRVPVLVAALLASSSTSWATGICDEIEVTYRPWRAQVEQKIASGKAELAAWERERKEAAEEGSRWKNILNGLFSEHRIYPPRAGAELNTAMGARDCLDEVLALCPRDFPEPEGTPGTRAHDAALNAQVDALRARLTAMADAAWQMSLERKELLDRTGELRWGAEANRFAGYTTQCRDIADYVAGLRRKLDDLTAVPAGIPGSCAEALARERYFCVIPSGDYDEDDPQARAWAELHERCCPY